jgi:dTDP-4-dehydrorhamnose 3,5-epimerase-like enzyme
MKTKIDIVSNFYIIDIPKIIDKKGRGNLSVIEKDCLPFKLERVYYLYDVPSGAYRGGHAHKVQQEFLVPLSGSFDVVLNDANGTKKITLNKPDKGLFIGEKVWRELDNFSSGAVCLVLASGVFDESDYIRDYNVFKSLICG